MNLLQDLINKSIRNKRGLFFSATLRLTLWYLAIIMLISILFSVVLYRVSTREFDREILIELKHAPTFFQPKGFSEFRKLRLEQVNESRNNIKFNLFIFNFIILGTGGLLSYWLAKRTLRPIEQAHDAQNRFIADASHELRTPLTAMKTEIEVALRDRDLTIKESKLLHKSTLEEVERLESLTNGLLKLARVDNNGEKKSVKKCSVDKLVEEVVNKMSLLSDKKRILLNAELTPGFVNCERESIKELITILVDNAIKYSPEGSTINVSTALRKKSNSFILKIKDEGIGIKASDLPHIFERFYRADLSRSQQNVYGYGLGLSIAKKIVETHEGKITVDSKPGIGTTFTIRLPLTKSNLR